MPPHMDELGRSTWKLNTQDGVLVSLRWRWEIWSVKEIFIQNGIVRNRSPTHTIPWKTCGSHWMPLLCVNAGKPCQVNELTVNYMIYIYKIGQVYIYYCFLKRRFEEMMNPNFHLWLLILRLKKFFLRASIKCFVVFEFSHTFNILMCLNLVLSE